MSMVAGSVTIAATSGGRPNGDPTTRAGSGYALVLFDAMVAAKAAQSPPIPPPVPILDGYDVAKYGGGGPNAPGYAKDVVTVPKSGGGTQRMAGPVTADDQDQVNKGRNAYFQDLASTCTAIASVITYLLSNAVVNIGTMTVEVTSQKLGRVPSPNTTGTDIDPPFSPVNIPITGSGTLT